MVMQSQITLAQNPTINTTVYADKTRFESQEENAEFRVEVFDSSGQKMFDSGFVAGKTLDWIMLDQQGERIADGVYEYLVTIKNRHGKERGTQSRQLAILRDGQDLEKAPTLMQLAAGPGAGGGSGNITGSGTAGQITKWTGATTLGDSVITESSGKVGIGTTNPVSLLHIIGSHPATSTLAGTNATEGLRLNGGKGGDTSGSGQTAGIGAGVVLQAGDGGDALSGTSGRGGFVTIQPGAPGVGALNGAFGQVILAPGGGNVGIGITNGASKLTVAGMIETTLGGLKFPDGTLQTTAATSGLASVFHDVTLTGNGTGGSPLGIAPLGVATNHLANAAVTAPKINTTAAPTSGQVLGFNGSSLVWQSPSVFSGVAHDATLMGNGAAVAPLGVAIPLRLFDSPGSGIQSVLLVVNTVPSGLGATIIGGDSATGEGIPSGSGVRALGGMGLFGDHGGIGVEAFGGEADSGVSTSGNGGTGMKAFGGASSSGNGGLGVEVIGGHSDSGEGGFGADIRGGTSTSGLGGTGMVVFSGTGPQGSGPAAEFNGAVYILGNLNVAGTKNFKIDHPLDPENKYLIHAAIESSEVLNIYNGNVRLDQDGEAVVQLPNWFEALNNDFRYSLTSIGAPGTGLYIANEVKGNRFKISGGAPGAKVSWQVTGVRSDAAMLKHPFKVEQDKPARERGSYLSPDAYNQPEEKRIEWARNPELMKQMKERREQMTQKRARQ